MLGVFLKPPWLIKRELFEDLKEESKKNFASLKEFLKASVIHKEMVIQKPVLKQE